MGAAPVAIALVGLVFPIVLLLAGVAFDVALVCWLLWRLRQAHTRAMRIAKRPVASRISRVAAAPRMLVWK